MGKRKLSALLVILALLLTLIPGCGGSAGSNSKGKELKEKEVVIGITGAFSGASAEYSMNNRDGIQWAIDKVNSEGGYVIGDERVKFKLEYLDDKADSATAVANAQKLVDLYKTPIIFNNSTTQLLSLMNINQEKGAEFILTAYASHNALSTKGNKLAVPMVPNFRTYPAVYARMAIEKGYKTAGLFCNTGTYGDDWESLFTKAFEEAGGKVIVAKEANYFTESDYSAQATAIAAAKPDCILVGGPSTGTALAIEQIRSMGYKGAFFIIDQAKTDEIIKYLKGDTKLLANCVGLTPFPSVPLKKVQEFVKWVEKNYNKTPSADMGYTYSGMSSLLSAMNKAQTYTDVYKIRETIASVVPEESLPYSNRGISSGGRLLNHCTCLEFDQDGKASKCYFILNYCETPEEYNKEVEWYKSQFDSSVGLEIEYLQNFIEDKNQ